MNQRRRKSSHSKADSSVSNPSYQTIGLGLVVGACLVVAMGTWYYYGADPSISLSKQPEAEPEASSKPADETRVGIPSNPVVALPEPSEELKQTPTKPQFVGVDACRDCHRERVDEFVHTGHYLASRRAIGDGVSGDFESNNRYQSRDENVSFEMEIDGEGFKQTALIRQGTDVERETKLVGMVFGAGKYDENYHYWDGNRLFRLPMAWLRSRHEWINTPGFLDGTADFERTVGPRCLECHSTWIEHVPGTRNAYKPETAILGVTCERCHGPASGHIDFHRANEGAEEAHHIVNPSHLERERRIEVCSQCHSETSRRRSAPFSFVPGDKLADHYSTDAPKHPELDHTANQTQQMKASACFQKSQSLTCITCHDPHHREDEPALHTATCYGCHQAKDCGEHTKLPEPVREKCIDCHMPSQPVMNITFATATDEYIPLISRHNHRIGIHARATKLTFREWLLEQDDPEKVEQAEELATELAGSFADEATRLVQDHRYVAARGLFDQALSLVPDDATILAAADAAKRTRAELDQRLKRAKEAVQAAQANDWTRGATLDEAIRRVRESLELKPEHALNRYTLAVLLHKNAEAAAAEGELKTALEADSEHVGCYLLWGQIAEQRGDLTEALGHIRKAEELEPYNAEVHVKLGTLHAQLGQWTDAARHLRQSLEMNPQDIWCYSRLAMTLVEMGELQEALRVAQRAASLTKYADHETLQVLMTVYEKLGMNADAAKIRARLPKSD